MGKGDFTCVEWRVDRENVLRDVSFPTVSV